MIDMSLPNLATNRYAPLDEQLERPSIRILRALRWHDWITANDLMIVLNVPDYDRASNRERNAYVSSLRRLVALGDVMRDTTYYPSRYRLTSRSKT